MSEELKPEDQIKALQQEVQSLKDQVFVLTDKANQALIGLESQNALVLGLISQSKDKKGLLAQYLYLCKQVDASGVDKKRSEFEMEVKNLIRQNAIEHLRMK